MVRRHPEACLDVVPARGIGLGPVMAVVAEVLLVLAADEALEVLLQLQYKRTEAEEMIASVLKANPHVKDAEELIRIIFKNEHQARVGV